MISSLSGGLEMVSSIGDSCLCMGLWKWPKVEMPMGIETVSNVIDTIYHDRQCIAYDKAFLSESEE